MLVEPLGVMRCTQTLTVTNGAYTIGDVVGGLITFTNAVRIPGGLSVLKSISLTNTVGIAYELWLMNGNIATPALDNAAFALAAADMSKLLGHVPIAATDFKVAQNAFAIASIGNIFKHVQAAPTLTSIYAYLKATAVTSPATTTMYISADFEYLN